MPPATVTPIDLLVAADKYRDVVSTLEYSRRMLLDAEREADKWRRNVAELCSKHDELWDQLREAVEAV